jgi:hypothetical protein
MYMHTHNIDIYTYIYIHTYIHTYIHRTNVSHYTAVLVTWKHGKLAERTLFWASFCALGLWQPRESKMNAWYCHAYNMCMYMRACVCVYVSIYRGEIVRFWASFCALGLWQLWESKIHVCVRLCICIYVCMHVCMHYYVCSMYVYVYVYVYMEERDPCFGHRFAHWVYDSQAKVRYMYVLLYM